MAQQTTGAPGSPSATTTIDGRYLPPPPQRFQGEINLNGAQSKPAWPARVVPPEGAPNIVLIITDDVGYGAPSTFGGVIPTPILDRLANDGLRYTNFHTTALCSPTRACLITGRNHHSVGFGVISEISTGFPGYNSILPKDAASVTYSITSSAITSTPGGRSMASVFRGLRVNDEVELGCPHHGKVGRL